jgi:CelD/BcsL family acetyltransferase involved in cellulose biosynthesis
LAEIIDRTITRDASAADAAPRHAGRRSASSRLTSLDNVPVAAWRMLATTSLEPNGYYLPEWALAVNASARGRTGMSALCAWSASNASCLVGLMPVTSLWRACRIPLPALVSGDPYGTLCTPLLARDDARAAAGELLEAARRAGARALLLHDMALDGPVMRTFEDILDRDGLHPRVLQSYPRASLDATGDGDERLRDALGAKKLKELRRQQHRLAEHGDVSFEIARTPAEVAAALEIFLRLEASGWKGQRGTALIQHDGDATFIRRAASALAENGQCEVVTLRAGDNAVAAGIVLRQQSRAFFFKLGIDETYAKYSPGVQLTLALTRHLCADPEIGSADSTAGPDHPMINPIWRDRFTIGDVLIPLRRHDPVVAIIYAALAARQTAFELARRGVHFIRSSRRQVMK